MDALFSIVVGLGLAAACGMRVFLPLLAMSIATHTGVLTPGGPMEWLGTWPALLTLSTATVVEVIAYYIPWVDNALDSIATPLAAVAGALAASAVMLPPEAHLALTGGAAEALGPSGATGISGWQWAGSLLSGAAAAGSTQVLTVGTRALSTSTTGGLANPVVATAETAGAASLSIMFLITPLIGLVLLLTAGILGYRWFFRRSAKAAPSPAVAPARLRRSWFRPWKRVPAC
ncbi:MAG: DUF4126 domain-containing protein [Phycisphaerales bacterium]